MPSKGDGDSRATAASSKGEDATLSALQDACSHLEEQRGVLEQRRILRERNLAPERPDEAALNRRESSIKRNSALLKKLRGLSDDSAAAVVKDVQMTNQSKYVSEVVAALLEAPLRNKDVAAAVQVCSLLHQTYPDFAAALVPGLSRLAAPPADEERAPASKRRGALRLLAELLLVGCYTDASPLVAAVRQLAAAVCEYMHDKEGGATALGLLSSLVKALRAELLGAGAGGGGAAEDALQGLVQQDAADQSSALSAAVSAVRAAQDALAAEQKAAWRLAKDAGSELGRAVKRAFDSACGAVRDEAAALSEAERHNARVLNNRGELPEELAAQYERLRKQYDGLYRSLAGLAELLDLPLPELKEGVTRVAAPADGAGGGAAAEGDEAGPLFEDEEARAFYQSLPDLHALVPAVLLQADRDKDKAAGAAGGGEATDKGAAAAEAAGAGKGAGGGAAAGVAALSEEAAGAKAGSGGKGEAAGGPGLGASDGGGDAAAGSGGGGVSGELDALLRSLPGCVSRESCDELAVNFCYANSRAARRRLVRCLTDVPWGSLALLPFYARIAATLSACFPDVGAGVTKWCEDEFAFLLARRDPTARSLEARLRVSRYLGELAKFGLVPHGTLFSCLKALLDDFSGHNVDMAAELVGTAGRYLLRLPETHTRMANMAEVMLKLKNARNLDARQSGLVDAAYLAVRPPARGARRAKERSPVQQYVRHLVYDRLGQGDVNKVMKKLRRLPWAEQEPYLLRTLLKAAAKGRYSAVPQLASLAAGLSKYHPSLGVRLADEALEEIRVGLEQPDAGTYQRRVAAVRLLGELYNYRLVDSSVVFDCLQALLSYGYDAGPQAAARLDPPHSYFRIRLVCVLLGACGQYFSKGSARRRLDAQLTYLQRYVLAKPQPLPLDIEFDLQDLFEALRPAMKRHSTFEEAAAAVAALEAAESGNGGPGGLAAVHEDEEEEEEEEEEGVDEGDESGSERDASDGSDSEGSERGEGVTESETEGGAPRGGNDDDDDDVTLITPLRGARRDEAFEAEMEAFLAEASGRPPPVAAAAAATTSGEHAAAAGPAAGRGGDQGEEGSGDMEQVSFKVVLRRGGRDDRSRELLVPASTGMAVSLKAVVAAEAGERQLMKKLVLQAEQREEEEAYLADLMPQYAQRGGGGKGQQRGEGDGGGRRKPRPKGVPLSAFEAFE